MVVPGLGRSTGLWAGCLGEFKVKSFDFPKVLTYQCLPGACSQGLLGEARSQVGPSEEAEITCSWESGNDTKKTLELELQEG